MNNRIYQFSTKTGNYIFDGDEVAVYLEEENKSSKNKPKQVINSHRVNFLKTICLVLNNSCNLACKYCYANKGVYDKPNAKMSYNKAISAIDDLASSVISHNSSDITIAFFGGEPLLRFELIKKLVDYAENTYPLLNKKYLITTNGTLMTKEITSFMEKYNFNIMISIDGNKKVHDYNRVYRNGAGSYNQVLKAISCIEKPYLLNARITVTDTNADFDKYIDSILKTGIKRITFAVDYNISEEKFYMYLKAIKDLAKKYLKDIKNNKFYEITNFSTIISYIICNTRVKAHCNAGVSYVTLSADGKYYKCPRFVGDPKFCMGETNSEVINFSKDFLKRLKNSAIDRCKDCRDCPFVYICGGVCFHHAYMSNKKIFQNVSMECSEKKTVFKEVLNLMCSLNIEERKNFLLFLTSLWEKNNQKGGDCND